MKIADVETQGIKIIIKENTTVSIEYFNGTNTLIDDVTPEEYREFITKVLGSPSPRK